MQIQQTNAELKQARYNTKEWAYLILYTSSYAQLVSRPQIHEKNSHSLLNPNVAFDLPSFYSWAVEVLGCP